MLYPHILHETRCEHPDCADIPSWARDLAFLIDDSRETIMGNLDKLTADVALLITAGQAKDSRIADLEAENAQLKADQTTQAGNDQAAIDALDATVIAALPGTPAVTTPAAPAQTLYIHTDGNPFDSAQYVAAGTAPDGTPLFTFNGDLNPGDTTGVNADFAVYTA